MFIQILQIFNNNNHLVEMDEMMCIFSKWIRYGFFPIRIGFARMAKNKLGTHKLHLSFSFEMRIHVAVLFFFFCVFVVSVCDVSLQCDRMKSLFFECVAFKWLSSIFGISLTSEMDSLKQSHTERQQQIH